MKVSHSLYAEKEGVVHSAKIDKSEKRERGQFFTPALISRFMAMLADVEVLKGEVSILDPGAGLGILSVSLVEYLLEMNKTVSNIHVEAHETDIQLIEGLESQYVSLGQSVKEQGVDFTYKIITNGFVEYYSSSFNSEVFDLVISNPPYFKLSRDYNDHLPEEINKCPNAYALFQTMSSHLVKPGGQMVFITPRSFTSGKYFEKFRNDLLSRCSLERIHTFESRSKPFKSEKVLQETVITVFSKRRQSSTVLISHSNDFADLDKMTWMNLSKDEIIDSVNQNIIRIPKDQNEKMIIERIQKFEHYLKDIGFKASTGPVVSFRTRELHSEEMDADAIPFLWMNNVDTGRVVWPKKLVNRPQYFKCNISRSLTTSFKDVVLVRRFSTKDDRRRVIAAHLAISEFPTSSIAIENKLNYIFAEETEFSTDAFRGLAGYLNSDIVDGYFRIINGNTNVSSSELGIIPVPSLNELEKLGLLLKEEDETEYTIVVNNFINQVLAEHEV